MRAISAATVRATTRKSFVPMAPRTPFMTSSFARSVTPMTRMRYYSDEAKKEEAKEGNENSTEEQSEIKKLENQLSAKTKEASELKDRLLRSVADFRNLQQVTKKDIQKAKDFALQKFAKDLLESVDNFGHALNAFKEEDLQKSKEISDLYTGDRMTRDVFENTLRKHGIEKLDPLGEPFDPNKHLSLIHILQPKLS